MNDDALVHVLEDAGLSPYQAEAYVTLLELGAASATDIAEACEVPDPRIYDVLRDLETKGYVETYQQDSLRARAHDPETVLGDLRDRSTRYLSAAEEIEERWNQPAVAEHEVSIVKRFSTVLNRARELIAEAEDEVVVGVTLDLYHELRPDLAAAHDRGVHVKLTICANGDAGDLPDETDLAGVCTEARHQEFAAPFLLVVDRTWTCFAPYHRSVNEYGVLVNDRTHTHVFHWFFLSVMWEIWDTIYTERTDDTPITYVDMPECLRHVVPLLEAGATIEATVEGVRTETQEPVELEGYIVDAHYSGDSIATDGTVPLSQLAGRNSVTIETEDGATHEIGGWGAVVEEIGASRITITSVTET